MLNPVNLNTSSIKPYYSFKAKNAENNSVSTSGTVDILKNMPYMTPPQINTTLTQEDMKQYNYLLNFLKDCNYSENSDGLTPNAQLDLLLKNGKLLKTSHNDHSTVLSNLYEMASTPRHEGLDAKRVICDTLDLLVNPRYVTQTFGDIPQHEKKAILSHQSPDSNVVKDPSLMDVKASGTCAAASCEVNYADKYPADFALWVSKLSSKDGELILNTDLSAISKNKLEAAEILKFLSADNQKFSLIDKNKIRISLDENAYIRAQIQGKYWDKGERNVADVLVQSAIMQAGSQRTYDSLTDTRAATFNDNTQGLVEVEKTFIESLMKNKEITSLVYQQIDDNQNLVGYTCSFDKMQKHIIDTLDSGDDVIVGYILTNESAGRTQSPDFDPKKEGAPNMVINGHEITIVDYVKTDDGKINFICVDTDDDNSQFVSYSADWLLPKIHHAGYPAEIVKDDEKEIMSKLQ